MTIRSWNGKTMNKHNQFVYNIFYFVKVDMSMRSLILLFALFVVIWRKVEKQKIEWKIQNKKERNEGKKTYYSIPNRYTFLIIFVLFWILITQTHVAVIMIRMHSKTKIIKEKNCNGGEGIQRKSGTQQTANSKCIFSYFRGRDCKWNLWKSFDNSKCGLLSVVRHYCNTPVLVCAFSCWYTRFWTTFSAQRSRIQAHTHKHKRKNYALLLDEWRKDREEC